MSRAPIEHIARVVPGGDQILVGARGRPTSQGGDRDARRAAPRSLLSSLDDPLVRILEKVGMTREALDGLSQAERAYVQQCIDEMVDTGVSSTARQLAEADYKWMPVSCEQFLSDPYYMGGDPTAALFPKCREALIDIFDGGKPPVEVILAGAIGWGKTTMAGLGICYEMYTMGCLRNPHAFYGIMPGAPITFALYSVSKEQSADSAFGKIISWIEQSPYFKEKMPKVGKHTTRAKFAGTPILLITGSQEVHAIGKDVYSFLLDEANFLTSKNAGEDDQSRAYAIYTNAKDRLRSRFMDGEGEIPGKVWLISSKRTHASFLEKHVADSKDDISEGRTKLYEYSQWAVRPPEKFKKPKFQVEVGDRIYPSRILQPGEDARQGAEVIIVPGEYRESFEKDIDSALRNMAGVATVSMCPLFRDKTVIERCITDELAHPFTRPEITTDINDDVGIETYFRPEVLFQVKMSRYLLRSCPDAPRFMHVDIGLTSDSMGIACVHQSGWKTVRRTRGDGTWYEDKAPVVTADFVIRIAPPKGSEIDLSKMRAFIISLRDMGMHIWRVTLDGYQSRDTMQLLRKLDFDAVLYSVDKTDDAYMTLRQAYTESRIRHYAYPTLQRELGELERNIEEGTVNHPKTSPSTGLPGSKDVADALAGATYNCLIDLKAHTPGTSSTAPDLTVSTTRRVGAEMPWGVLDKEAMK